MNAVYEDENENFCYKYVNMLKEMQKRDDKEKGGFMCINFAVIVKGQGKISPSSIEFAPRSAVVAKEKEKSWIHSHRNSPRECSGCKKREDS